MRIVLIAGAALALAACGDTHIAKPSDVYLHCADEPDAPAGDPVTGDVSDEQDAAYKGQLRGAWHDCSSKLQYVSDWFAKLPD